MAVTQTKIPFGYGWCNIKLYRSDGYPGDPAYQNGYVFEVDTNSFVDIEEVAWEAITIHSARRKHLDKIHLSFDLRLKENSALTSTDGYCDADAILRFMHYYYHQTTDDKAVRIFPARTTANNFIEIDGVNNWMCIVDSIKLVNVVNDSRLFGQELLLKCRTKIPIDPTEWSVFYRNTADSNFFSGVDAPPAIGGTHNIYFT